MFHSYESFLKCSGTAQPGTKNLSRACARWPLANTGGAYGIYNCRPPSLHGEGRALDIGFPGVANPAGTALVRALIANAWELGLIGVIWNRRRWSARNPNSAPYTGPSPHTDHIHVEQTWDASRNRPLTLEAAYRLLTVSEEDEMVLREGSTGPAVRLAQKAFNAWQLSAGNPAAITEDGIYGPSTTVAVRTYQTAAGLSATGTLDGVTAAYLLRYV